jgi:hypothetical protein
MFWACAQETLIPCAYTCGSLVDDKSVCGSLFAIFEPQTDDVCRSRFVDPSPNRHAAAVKI